MSVYVYVFLYVCVSGCKVVGICVVGVIALCASISADGPMCAWCVYVCMGVCMGACMSVSFCVRICGCMYVDVHVYVCMCVYVCASLSVCMYLCGCVCVRMFLSMCL